MISFLVISDNQQKTDAWIRDTVSGHNVSKFDVIFVEKDGTEKNTIGIEQIRLIQKKLALRPLQGQVKAVVIKKAELLTIEAQNALLKTLEEPPEDTIIIVAAKQKEALIPTIVSRCRIIDLGFETPTLSPNEIEQYQSLIQSLRELGIGERLKQAETLAKDKNEAITWLEKLIITTRGELIASLYSSSDPEPSEVESKSNVILEQSRIDSRFRENDNKSYQQVYTEQSRSARTINYYHILLTTLQKAHSILSTTNVNPRLALENMFLSFNPKV